VTAGKDCVLVEVPRRAMLKLIASVESVRKQVDETFLKRAVRAYLAPMLPEEDLNELVADGHLVNDKFEPTFDSPEGVAALTFYADLINGKKVTPPGTTSASWDNVATSFSDGLSAMTMNYHDLSLSPSVKGSVAYAVIPMGKSIGPHFGT
jgi:ABC-type glycerol-3-phosphate transport system substrate-binding protein